LRRGDALLFNGTIERECLSQKRPALEIMLFPTSRFLALPRYDKQC
jgi:hypothetical protein